jgi:hypothetical protein
MGVESSAVTITVQVVDANSGAELQRIVQGFQSVKSAAAGAEKSVRQANAAIPGMRWSMRQVSQSAQEFGGHVMTDLDNVRLLRAELGIRIPRAMETMIARSQALMGVINGLGGVMAGIGGGMVIYAMGEQLVNVYQKWFSLTGAAKEYEKELQKAKDDNFADTHSIETTRLRIDEATEAVKQFHQQMEASAKDSFGSSLLDTLGGGGGIGSVYDLYRRYKGHEASEKEKQQREFLDKLQRVNVAEQTHEGNLRSIESEHALDAELRGRAKITAELKKQRELNAENRAFANATDRAWGNSIPANAGSAEETAKNAIAEREAQAETFNLQREQSIEIRHLREQALEAGLRGEALYHAQEAAAIADLRDKDMDSVAARSAVHAKFHADEMKRLHEEELATEKIEREASVAGLSGLAKTQAEGANRAADINADEALSPAQRARRIAAAQQQTNAEIAAQQESFTDKINAIVDSNAEHQISGFARIRAEAQRQLDQLQRDFDNQTRGLDVWAPGGIEQYGAAYSQLQRGRNAINAGAGQQTADLARKNAQETEEIEAQARIKSLSADKQQTAQIELEYEDRLRKLQESLQQQEISWDDYNRRVAAAGVERDAQMEESAREARQKIAGEMRGLFGAHPLEALQQMGSKYAAEAGASILQRIGGHFGGHASSPEGIMARIAGAPHAGFGGGHRVTATGSAMSIATAEIHVGSAAIFGMSGGAGSGGFRSASWTGSASPALGGGAGFGGGNTGGGFGGSFGGGFSGGGSGISSLAGTAMQGVSDAKSLAGMFHGSADVTPGSNAGLIAAGNKLSTTDPLTAPNSSWSKSILGGGLTKANALGTAGAGLGLFSAWKQGGVGGMMSGTMSGAQMGMEVGGPVGAAVGAAVGFAMGFFGGSEQARVYDLKQVRPRIANDAQGFNTGSMDYMSAYNDLESLMTEAKNTTNKMGFAGQRYYQNTIKGELNQAMATLSREQKAGRSMYGFSAAQFDVGADSIPRDGYAFIHQRERIIPSDQNERITRAIEGQSMMPVQPSAGWGGDLHVHAIDGKSALQFLMANKHGVRAAINASYGENSGGADAL